MRSQQAVTSEIKPGDASADSEPAVAPRRRRSRAGVPPESPPLVVTPSTASGQRQITRLPVGHLIANPFQPRVIAHDEDLTRLAESIRRYGFMGHIEVRHDPTDHGKPLQIVFGHRRVEAAKLAGLATVPAVIVERSDDQMRQITFVENAARKALTYWEEAVFLGTMKRELGLSVRQIAEALSVGKSYVQDRLDLLKLPEGPLREAAKRDEVGFSTAWLLSQMPLEERDELFAQVRAGTINVSDLRMLRRAESRRKAELEQRADDEAHGRVLTVPALDPVATRLRWAEPPNPIQEAANRAAVSAEVRRVAEERAGSGVALPTPVRAEPVRQDAGERWAAAAGDSRPSPVAPVTPAVLRPVAMEPAAASVQDEPRVFFDRTVFHATTGHDYARQVITQLEANAYHLGVKLEKADFAVLQPDKAAKLSEAKAALLALLERVP